MEPDDDWTSEHPRKAEVEALEAEVREHAGTIAHALMNEIGRAFGVWVRNSVDLYALLAYAETDEEMQMELIRNVGDQSKREDYMRALDKHMHAYTASLGTLIDITRRVMDKYPDTDLYREWERRSLIVRAVEGAEFIRQLRNFLSHFANPPINTRGDLIAGTAEVLLDPESLNGYKKWSAASKDYIAAHPDGVRLSTIMPTYQQSMQEFYAWLLDAFGSHHDPDFDAVNDLIRRRNLALTDDVSDGQDWELRTQHIGENLAADREGRPQTHFDDWKAARDAQKNGS